MMATVTTPSLESLHSVVDLVDRLGGISADRIGLPPHPGAAVEEDVILARERKEGAAPDVFTRSADNDGLNWRRSAAGVFAAAC